MGEAYFYHLTDSTLEVALPALIERARGAGWRIEVRVPDAATAAMLDDALWLGGEEKFLPHGRAGGQHDDLQPVLICVEGQAATNGATCLMSVGGAVVTDRELAALDRACILFDGHDDGAKAAARTQWKTLTAAGAGAQYWAQDGGKWTCRQKTAAT